MKQLLTMVMSFLISLSCNTKRNNSETIYINNNSAKIKDTMRVTSDSNLYFQIGSLGKNDTFEIKWYSENLYKMKEPIIYNLENGVEIYRFTWLRTFSNPIAVRLEKKDNSCMLFLKILDGKGGYDPGELSVNQEKNVSMDKWKKFLDKLNDLEFWNMPIKDKRIGFDGAKWILEGKKENQYHVVIRWSPEHDNEFFKCCCYLLELTDLKLVDEEIY